MSKHLLDRITEIQLVLIQRFLDLGVDGGYFGDDYGAQKNLLFSPAAWRRLIKPRLARMFAPFLERGLPVLMHSDGQIQKILPDLVEIGLTTLNPVQPEVLEHAWLAEYLWRQARLLRRHLHPDCAAQWDAGRGPRGGEGLRPAARPERHRSDACAITPHDDRYSHGKC